MVFFLFCFICRQSESLQEIQFPNNKIPSQCISLSRRRRMYVFQISPSVYRKLGKTLPMRSWRPVAFVIEFLHAQIYTHSQLHCVA